jgi:hypothetical protein
MKVKFTFVAPLLGTVSGNQQLAKDFIIGKVLTDKTISEADQRKITAEEAKTLPQDIEEQIEDSSTYFHRDEDGKPFIYGYMIKGFFKAACDAMIDSGQFTAKELKDAKLGRWSYKNTINKLLAIKTRRLMLQTPGDKGLEEVFVERSLRAETMKGDRICLVRSEAAPEGTVVEFEFVLLNAKLQPFVEWWLNYGEVFGGIGQWRSSHYGSFVWEEVV